MNDSLFRKQAMQQLGSPDQLDQLMEVTTTRGWFVLLALGIILTVIVLWGIFGSVPVRVNGEGVILLKGNVISVFAATSGKIQKVSIQTGETVEKGQICAVIFNESLEGKIDDLSLKLAAKRKQHKDELAEEKAVFRLFMETIKIQRKNNTAALIDAQRTLASFNELTKAQRATLAHSTQNLQKRLVFLNQKAANQEELYRDQLITMQALNTTRLEILDAETEIQKVADEIRKVNLQEEERKNDFEERRRKTAADMESLDDQERRHLSSLNEMIIKAESEIRQLENELDYARDETQNLSIITCPVSGRVLNLEGKVGMIVTAGDRITLIDAMESEKDPVFDVVAYISPGDGKRIAPDMEIQVVPATVKAEEYGIMQGKVVSVSEFPVSHQDILNVIENPEFTQIFLKRGAPIEVRVNLIIDPNTPSGFRWSSADGPPMKIHPGTLCSVYAVVRRQSPVSLVIPLLREAVFGREAGLQ